MTAAGSRALFCKRGHPLDAANTYVARSGRRNCRKCIALRKKAYRQKANLARPPKPTSILHIDGRGVITIQLTRGYVSVLDGADHDLANLKWTSSSGDVYAVRHAPKHIYLHQLILERVLGRSLGKDEVCDHINRNKLDNRRCNLRVATHAQNNWNTGLSKANKSGTRGVRWDKRRENWTARIGVNRKTIYLGAFDDLDDAVEARRQAELVYFGDYSPLTVVGSGSK